MLQPRSVQSVVSRISLVSTVVIYRICSRTWLLIVSVLCSIAASVTRFHRFRSAHALAANCGLPVLPKICCPRHGQNEELLESQIKVAIGKVP